MAYQKLTLSIPSSATVVPAAPALTWTVMRTGTTLRANKSLCKALGLSDSVDSIDIYLDTERKLIGLDAGKKMQYPVKTTKWGNAAVPALRYAFAMLKLPPPVAGKSIVIPVEVGKHLPAPLLAQFSYAALAPVKRGDE